MSRLDLFEINRYYRIFTNPIICKINFQQNKDMSLFGNNGNNVMEKNGEGASASNFWILTLIHS